MDDDEPTAPKAWQDAWAARMLEIVPILAERNAILPKTNWVTTRVQVICRNGERIVSHHLHPRINQWSTENRVTIYFDTIDMIESSTLTVMTFDTFEDLVLFKLTFEGLDLHEV